MTTTATATTATASPIVRIKALGFPWETIDPFLFCAYHDDAYPKANAQMGPEASLAGRDLGQDFSRKDGWSMYHGHPVPGFPGHPHRGFETVTIVRKGLIDHSDSLGATARFGGGDVQWLTAGKGIVHSEMFPLLDAAAPNPLELFQIWLNLPARNKMAEPHFTMFWAEDVPHASPRWMPTAMRPRSRWSQAVSGRWTASRAPAGRWRRRPTRGPRSPMRTSRSGPSAWSPMPAGCCRPRPARARGARCISSRAHRSAWRARRSSSTPPSSCAPTRAVELVNGDEASEFLLLQGRPIGEPVAQYGPFVMNTQAEIAQAMADYRRTQFGGWPWPDMAPVHGRDPARFARHPDGREESGRSSLAARRRLGEPAPAGALVEAHAREEEVPGEADVAHVAGRDGAQAEEAARGRSA